MIRNQNKKKARKATKINPCASSSSKIDADLESLEKDAVFHTQKCAKNSLNMVMPPGLDVMDVIIFIQNCVELQ
jgi:hypothetical protein